jgi:radical SAM protein with 4Fe4S-binding SPASM domain
MRSPDRGRERRVGVGLLPATAVLELTYRCNHECVFCSCPWYADGFERLPEMPVSQWKELLDALAAQGVSEFAFSGGEPLLKEGWREIVSHASGLRVRRPAQRSAPDGRPGIHLISNGRAMTDDALRFLAGLGVHLMFSLPGLDTYQEHTGGDSPDRVLGLFEKVAALGPAATVGVTVTRRNLNEVYSTVGEAFLAGAGDLLLNRFLPGGRGLARWRDLSLDRDDTKRMLDEAEAALRASGRPGHVGTELPRCGFEASALAQLQVGTRCGAAHLFFVVDPSGFVRVCNHSPTRLLHWTEMGRLWEEPHWRRFALHHHVAASCDGCAARHLCDAGCPEASRMLAGELGWDPLVGERQHCEPGASGSSRVA